MAMCNGSTTFGGYNASGVFPFEVDFVTNQYRNGSYTDDLSPVNMPNPSWAITVEQNGTANVPETKIWYNTAGQNYSNDLGTGYDVCAVMLPFLNQNSVELGQDDPGDCSSALSASCRNALLTYMSEMAWQQQLNTNLFSTSGQTLPQICENIYHGLSNSSDSANPWPKECKGDFTQSPAYPDWYVPLKGPSVNNWYLPLTGDGSSIISNNSNCPIQSGGEKFYPVRSFTPQDPELVAGGYDAATRNVWPLLSVYFSVENSNSEESESWTASTLSCARVKHFSQGSRVSPLLPSGTPYPQYHGFHWTPGAKVGVAIGVIGFLILVAGLGGWVWRRKVRHQNLLHIHGKVVDLGDEGARSEDIELSNRT